MKSLLEKIFPQDLSFPFFLSHGSRANAKNPIDFRITDSKITPTIDAKAIAEIAMMKVVRITVPETRALSSIAVLSERKAWTKGKPSPNDMPKSTLASRERIIP